MTARQKDRLHGAPLWVLQPRLFEAVLHIVSKHDVKQIITGANPRGWTEYSPEVEAILPLLKPASSAADVEQSIRRVFRKRFGNPLPEVTAMASEIWKCIRRPQHRRVLKDIVNLETPIQNAVNRIRRSHPRNDDQLRLALITALNNQAFQLKVEKDLARILPSLSR